MRVPRSLLIVSGSLALATCVDADPTALDRAPVPGLGLVPGPPGSFCGVATVVDLLADENVVVGTVEVVNDEDAVFVTFRANANAPLLKTAVAVGDDPADLPTNRNGSPQPGRFPYKANHRGGPTTVTWRVDGSPGAGEILHVAAFAEVSLDGEEEGAWGDGEEFDPAFGWATRFTHAVQSCDGTVIRTVPTSGGAILTAGLELVIPDGSLDEATTFAIAPTTLQEPDVPIIPGTAWEIEPSGTTFDPPALLTLAYRLEDLPPDFPEANLMCLVVSGGVSELIQPTTIDDVNHRITCPLSHLSIVAVAAPDGGPIAETVGVTDVVTINVRSPVVGSTVPEAIGVTDNVTVNVRSPVAPTLPETVGVTDNVVVNIRSPVGPTIPETIGVVDNVTVNVRSPVAPTIPELVGVTDDVTITVQPAATGNFAYIALQGEDAVAVLDRDTNTLLSNIAAGTFPFAVAVRPGGSEVYVTNRGDGSVSVIDVATQSVVATITNVASDPIDIAFSPDGATAYVVDNNTSVVGVIDATTRTVSTPLLGSAGLSRAIAVPASGTIAYVAGAADSVVVFDLVAGTAADTITGSFASGDIALTPGDAELWVTDRTNSEVVVFDAAAGTVLTTIPGIPATPQGIRIGPATAYVAHEASGLTPIDLATRTVGTAIGLTFDPEWLAVSADGAVAYVSEGRAGSLLAVVDLTSGSVITTLTVGSSPAKIGLTP